jgi:hypothetical protein
MSINQRDRALTIEGFEYGLIITIQSLAKWGG